MRLTGPLATLGPHSFGSGTMAGEMTTGRGNTVRKLVWGLAAALWLAPLVAMQFTREVNWTASDFVVFGVMLLLALGAYEVGTRLSSG